jgi:hypothetical protein
MYLVINAGKRFGEKKTNNLSVTIADASATSRFATEPVQPEDLSAVRF